MESEAALEGYCVDCKEQVATVRCVECRFVPILFICVSMSLYMRE